MNASMNATASMHGKTVIVFGAGCRGEGWNNGKAAAAAYARAGASVCCVDLDGELAEATADAITQADGTALAVRADVTDSASVARAVAETLSRLGRIDVLHNNVGVTHMGGPVELDEATWHLAIELNLGSVYRTAKAVLPHMIERGSGVIINISSLASLGWTGYPYFAYSASKAAVNQATVSMAMQYARHGIRANCVLPGAIHTPLIYTQIASQYSSVEAMIEARNQMVPMGRMGDPWDVANAAVFLASDQARFITGVGLPVDGGQSCAMVPLK
ncbi:SDR family NAD(P)-dependent oxidoreductase [Pandoraea terrigena]|uniref:Dihydroanticapsin 7-dehydrogenase n=1 Tax=Pandoraea terrigena TaxID=2508292 RepID=A0A5E4UA84_9BURK|nr:SDR family NAD(P)-dependent oxidoreductase [Pandoraea terrigena]VVD95784.1 Dihydroanticapsin 7-dehydrogenase [Pandoraea terrigena]